MEGVVAVHVGAGYHAERLRPLYKRTCKKACAAAVQRIRDGCCGVEAVAEAVTVLEDCTITNAGIGSNLTLSGVVECDASIMDGESLHFGSVGALSNIKNPIRVAQKVLEVQTKGLLSGGRVPPCTLVGAGAKDWALDHGFKFFRSEYLSTKSSEETYVKNLSLLEKLSSEECMDENNLLDTVGAVCLDSSGNVASAVSSGGLLLKQSGRIGQAAVYGSGCWAQNSPHCSVACSVTGIGECLIKTMFARECYQSTHSDPRSITSLPDTFRNKFLENPCLRHVSSKLAGVLLLKYFASEHCCELSWAHNTKTMVLGYMSTTSDKPIALCSAQSAHNIVGTERRIKLTSKS